MKTLLLRTTALCSLIVALTFSLAYSYGGGSGVSGDGDDIPDCPPGFQWDPQLKECVPMQWVIKPCYFAFGTSQPEKGFEATCQDGTTNGVLMECGAITNQAPLPFANPYECISPYEGGQAQ